MSSHPNVLICHPGRQHSHQTAYALQEGGMLRKYFTSIWYKPDRCPYRLIDFFPVDLRKIVLKEIKKRYFPPIEQNFVTQIPIYEVISQIIKLFSKLQYSKLIYWINDQFDRKVSREIIKMNFDILIGYEASSLTSFRKAKIMGKVTILDLAIAHYQLQCQVFRQCNFDPYGGDHALRDKVNHRKQKEIELADYFFVPSEFVRKSLLDHGISTAKIFKIPYGFDQTIFVKKDIYRKKGRFKILYVGGITKRKGIQYVLQALKELKLKNTEFVMIGGISDGKDVLTGYAGLYKHIPFLHHEDLVKHYQDADIFVFPSLLEGFAQVVVEAMACGTPVVVSTHTGSNEIVRDGMEGCLVPIMNVEKIKDAISYFYKHRIKVEEMGKNAAIQAENFTWQNYRQHIRDAIIEIVRRSKS